jgi:hypothetical protein
MDMAYSASNAVMSAFVLIMIFLKQTPQKRLGLENDARGLGMS